MQGLLPLEITRATGFTGVEIIGELEFIQKESFIVGKSYHEFDYSIVSTSTSTDLATLVQSYYQRDCKFCSSLLDFVRANYVSFLESVSSEEEITVRVKLRVPEKAKVRIVPAVTDEVLFGWIQYFYILLVVGFLMRAFVNHMYGYGIIPSEV